MLGIIKNVAKLSLLFLGLYVCSIIVVNIFMFIGAEFESGSNTAFIAALTACISLLLIQYFLSKKEKN